MALRRLGPAEKGKQKEKDALFRRKDIYRVETRIGERNKILHNPEGKGSSSSSKRGGGGGRESLTTQGRGYTRATSHTSKERRNATFPQTKGGGPTKEKKENGHKDIGKKKKN